MENESFDSIVMNERPQFLKVICTLSFIMCGLMILMGLFGLKNLFLSPEEIMSSNPYLQTMQDNNPMAYQAMLDSMQYKNMNALLSLITPLISLGGVILMWKMKKSGFYLYLVGEFLPYISIALTSGVSAMYASVSSLGEQGTTIINVFFGMVVIFDILFVVLYAVNLKHMK